MAKKGTGSIEASLATSKEPKTRSKTTLLTLLTEPAAIKFFTIVSRHIGGIQIILNLRGVCRAFKNQLDTLPPDIGYEVFRRAQAVLNVETENNHELVDFIETPPPIFVTSLRLIHAMQFAASNPKEKQDLSRLFIALWSLNSRLHTLEVNHLKIPLSPFLEHLTSSTSIKTFRCISIAWEDQPGQDTDGQFEFPQFLFNLEELDIVHLDLDAPHRELFWRKLNQSLTLKHLIVRNQFDKDSFVDIVNTTRNRPDFRFQFGVFRTNDEDNPTSRNNRKAKKKPDNSVWLFSGLMRRGFKKQDKRPPSPPKPLSPDSSSTAANHFDMKEKLHPTDVLPIELEAFRSFMDTVGKSNADIRLFDLHAQNLASAAKPDYGLRESYKAKFRSFVRSIDAVSEEDFIKLETFPNLEHVTFTTCPQLIEALPKYVKEVVIHEATSLAQFPCWKSLVYFQVADLKCSPYELMESLGNLNDQCPGLRGIDIGWSVLKDEEKTEITVDDGGFQPQMFRLLKYLKFTLFVDTANWTNQIQAETRGFLFYQIKVAQLSLRSFDFRRGLDHDKSKKKGSKGVAICTANSLPLFNFESFMKLLEVDSKIRKSLCIVHIDSDFIEDSALTMRDTLLEVAHANHHLRFGCRREDYDDYDVDIMQTEKDKHKQHPAAPIV